MPRNERFGYVMFMISGAIFLIMGIRNADAMTIIASVVWLLGCAAFLQSS